jgi:hypothetical protein
VLTASSAAVAPAAPVNSAIRRGVASYLLVDIEGPKPAFFKLWSADHKWSSGSALVVLGLTFYEIN